MSGVSSFIGRWSRRKRAAAEDLGAQAAASRSSPPCGQGLGVGVVDNAADGATPLPNPQAGREPAGSAAASLAQTTNTGGPVDLTKLPPIESITAESDIRAFLAPGVPLELTRAALRRAWAADPKIRDFVGLSENAWDFNAPGAIPGFGPLEMTDELRRRIAQMVGRQMGGSNVSDAAADGGSWRPAPQEVRAAIDRTSEFNAGTAEVTPPDIRLASKSEPEAPEAVVRGGVFSQCDSSDIAAQPEPGPQHPRRSTARGSHGGALPK